MNAFEQGHLPTSEPQDASATSSSSAVSYGQYQNHLYAAGMLHSSLPTVTTDPSRLEAQARSKMSLKAYNYVAGGAGERATMDANRLAFRTWKLVPRMLRPSGSGGQRSTRTTILGREYASPVVVAPVGVQRLFHECSEAGSARAAARVGVPFVMSTAASATIEDVAAASGEGERWFQLYWPQDDGLTLSLLGRAKKAGFRVLVVTLDTWALSWRPWDLDEAYVPFMTGMGNQVGFSDPVFRKMLADRGAKSPEEDVVGASLAWQKEVFSGKTHSWEHVRLLVDNWDGPVVLKGIQHPDDARKAAEMGVKGVICSNHGGRQMDGAVGSLEMLPEIVEALEGTGVEVLFDSGIRTGVDIIKALALGAKGVLVGRPWVYGMGIAGEKGAEAALRGLLADLDQSMGLAGISSVQELSKEWLRRCYYPGDRHANN